MVASVSGNAIATDAQQSSAKGASHSDSSADTSNFQFATGGNFWSGQIFTNRFSGEAPTNTSELFELWRPSPQQSFQIGSFILQPSLDIAMGGGYNSNLFAGKTNQSSDFSAQARPDVRISSQWSRHSLEFMAGSDGIAYKEFDSENQLNGYVGARGTLDITRDLKVAGNIRFKSDHETRGEGETFQLFESPVKTNQLESGISVSKRFNRLSFAIGGNVIIEDYDDATLVTSSGNQVVDQDFRDGTAYTLSTRANYVVSPLTSFFVTYNHNWRDYQAELFDSSGSSVSGGLSYEFSQLLKAEASAGILWQDSTGATLDDINTYTYNASLLWSPTRLIDVALIGSREVGGPSQFAGASNRISSDVGVRANYAIWSNLRLHSALAMSKAEFEDIDRDDTLLKAQLGAYYALNNYLSLFADYTFSTYLGDTLPDVDYNRDQIAIGVSVKLY